MTISPLSSITNHPNYPISPHLPNGISTQLIGISSSKSQPTQANYPPHTQSSKTSSPSLTSSPMLQTKQFQKLPQTQKLNQFIGGPLKLKPPLKLEIKPPIVFTKLTILPTSSISKNYEPKLGFYSVLQKNRVGYALSPA